MDLKHLIWTDDDTKPEQQKQPLVPPQAVSAAVSSPKAEFFNSVKPSFVPSTESDIHAKDMYEKLFTATDPQSTELKQVFGLAKPLEGIIADPKLRLKAALAQCNLKASTAVIAVAGLLTTLEEELGRFQTERDASLKATSTGDKKDLDYLQQQLTDIQSKIRITQGKITANEEALAAKSQGFDAAYAQRKQELNQLKSDFSNLG